MEKLNELIKDIEAVDSMCLDKKNVLKALNIAKKEISKQLLKNDVIGESEQLTYKCDYCQDDGVMITGLDCTCDAAPNKS